MYLYVNFKCVITLNNGARSNGRDKDEKKNIFVNVINEFIHNNIKFVHSKT